MAAAQCDLPDDLPVAAGDFHVTLLCRPDVTTCRTVSARPTWRHLTPCSQTTWTWRRPHVTALLLVAALVTLLLATVAVAAPVSPGKSAGSNTDTLNSIVTRERHRPHSKRQTWPSRLDVPQIECPEAEDGMQQFACPSPDDRGRWHCIDDHVLCDGRFHCPNGEDEDRTMCMFHKMTLSYFKVLTDAVFGWRR